MNTCIFSGTVFTNMAKDPIKVETKTFNNQSYASCTFNVSISEKTGKTDQQGKPVYKNALIHCKASGKTAEIVGQYFCPGKAIMVECEYEEYTVEKKVNGQVVVGNNGQPELEYRHIFKVTRVHFVPTDKPGTNPVSNNYDNRSTGQQINNQGNFNNQQQGSFNGQQTFQQPNFQQQGGFNPQYGMDINSMPFGNK